MNDNTDSAKLVSELREMSKEEFLMAANCDPDDDDPQAHVARARSLANAANLIERRAARDIPDARLQGEAVEPRHLCAHPLAKAAERLFNIARDARTIFPEKQDELNFAINDVAMALDNLASTPTPNDVKLIDKLNKHSTSPQATTDYWAPIARELMRQAAAALQATMGARVDEAKLAKQCEDAANFYKNRGKGNTVTAILLRKAAAALGEKQ